MPEVTQLLGELGFESRKLSTLSGVFTSLFAQYLAHGHPLITCLRDYTSGKHLLNNVYRNAFPDY